MSHMRRTRVTRALTQALKLQVEDPWRLLAIAVVGTAYCDGAVVDQHWLDLADIDAEAMGVLVAA